MTSKQKDYIELLCKQYKIHLPSMLEFMEKESLNDFSVDEASTLIDRIKNGGLEFRDQIRNMHSVSLFD